jgi:glycosyltransferase involved in cell wall biosynthesis
VTCLPSVTDAEAFGMVLIESMACGTPVVGFPVGGVPLVIADTGGGVVASSIGPGPLADALIEVVGSPDRRAALGVAGRQSVDERYTWAATVSRFEGLLTEVASST